MKHSKISMTVCQSSGTWLNDCPCKQRHYVSLNIQDPEGKIVVSAELSFEQMARMMLSNGLIPCTLSKYRDTTGKLVTEVVKPPETVEKRMNNRLKDVQASLEKRLEDVRQDLFEMVNGDTSRSKGNIENLLNDIKTIQSHLKANQEFVVHQAEEELDTMRNSIISQLDVFLSTKLNTPIDSTSIVNSLPISDSNEKKQLSNQPFIEEYTLKPRLKKSIDDMTSKEIAIQINNKLHEIEAIIETGNLYHASCSSINENKLSITYISYQGCSSMNLDEAKKYLKYLTTNVATKFKRHHSIVS